MIHVQGISSKSGVAITSGISSTNKLIQSYPLSTITVYDTGTTDLTPIFTDSEGQTVKANPFTANSDASFSFYVAPGRYDLRFSGTGITTPFTLSDIFVGNPGDTPAEIYSSLLEAVTEIGATPTNLVISTASFPSGGSSTVPTTLILEFRGAGTLLRQGSDVITVKSSTAGWPLRKLFLGTGTVVFTNSTAVAYTTPVWETANTTPGTTDMGDALTAAVTEAVTNKSPLIIPAGAYAYATAPNFGVANLTTQGLGQVILKHTGTGNILNVRDPAGADIRDVRILGNIHVYGNALSSVDGVVIEALGGNSRIELVGRGAPSVMFTNKFGVEAEYVQQVSVNVTGGWLGPRPVTGIRNCVGVGGAGNDPTNNRYWLTIEGVSGLGIANEGVSDCTFYGTSESNGAGVNEDSECRRNTYDNFYMDVNTVYGVATITAASIAAAVEFTTSGAHGLTTGDLVSIGGVATPVPWLAVLGRFSVTVTSATKFTIAVDSTTFGAFTGSLTASRGYDMLLAGQNTTLISPYIASAVALGVVTESTTGGVKIVGGQVRSINLHASSKNTSLQSVQIPDNAGLGISGTGTYRRNNQTYINGSVAITVVADDLLGRIAYLQPSPIAKTVAVLLSVDDLENGLIVGTPGVTGSTVNYQLPSGPNMEQSIGGLPNNGAIEWTLMDEATGVGDTITITVNTAHTIVGSPVIQSRTAVTATGTSVRFLSRRVSPGVWVTYRLGG